MILFVKFVLSQVSQSRPGAHMFVQVQAVEDLKSRPARERPARRIEYDAQRTAIAHDRNRLLDCAIPISVAINSGTGVMEDSHS